MPLHTADDLIRLVDRWERRRVVVVGDFMLDRYVYGSANRLSPDAPVPVLAVKRTEDKPGGAANVCLDLRALRCEVNCVGAAGDDAAGQAMRQALTDAGCDAAGLLQAGDRPTTVKTNFVGLAQHRHPQKMFRVDDESREPIDPAMQQALLDHVRSLLGDADVLCLEDYNKGVLTAELCQALIAAAREAGVEVLVDPAAIADFSKYAGAACVTPNRTEALTAARLDANLAGNADAGDPMTPVAQQLQASLDLDAIVLTLDKQGALLLQRDSEPVIAPTRARAVYDVTGAGDMVLAMLAAARANAADWPAAVQLANIAAGLEVERFGVAPIELDEVLLALLSERHEDLGKQRTLAQLLPELAAFRKQGKRIVFTNGCFDILHAGHVSYLRGARQQGDLLVVGLNSDDSIRRLKGQGRPVNHQHDRVLVLSELESVSYVVVFEEDTPMTLLEAIRPDVLAKGADYRKDQVVGGALVESYGGEIALIDLVEGRSTTNLIRKLSQ